jgi:hypothetical protein
MPADKFEPIDRTAGYYVSRQPVLPLSWLARLQFAKQRVSMSLTIQLRPSKEQAEFKLRINANETG